MQFVHIHKKNEELYILFRGNGIFFVDGEEFPIQGGSLIRIDPEGERALRAGSEDMYYIMRSGRSRQLDSGNKRDGIKLATRTSWI